MQPFFGTKPQTLELYWAVESASPLLGYISRAIGAVRLASGTYSTSSFLTV